MYKVPIILAIVLVGLLSYLSWTGAAAKAELVQANAELLMKNEQLYYFHTRKLPELTIHLKYGTYYLDMDQLRVTSEGEDEIPLPAAKDTAAFIQFVEDLTLRHHYIQEVLFAEGWSDTQVFDTWKKETVIPVLRQRPRWEPAMGIEWRWDTVAYLYLGKEPSDVKLVPCK